MSGKNETVIKLLPKQTQPPEPDREGPGGEVPRPVKLHNFLIGAVTALLLAFILMPRIPLLQRGDVAPRDITAPYTFYVEYQGPEQTVLLYKVEKGELIVESGRRVTERAAKLLEEIARREGVGKRL